MDMEKPSDRMQLVATVWIGVACASLLVAIVVGFWSAIVAIAGLR